MRAYKKRLVTTVTVSYSATATIRGSPSYRLPFGYHLVILSAIVCASRHQSKFLTFTFIIIAKCSQCSSVVTLQNQLSSLYQIIVVVIKIRSVLVILVLFFTYFGTLDRMFSASSFMLPVVSFVY